MTTATYNSTRTEHQDCDCPDCRPVTTLRSLSRAEFGVIYDDWLCEMRREMRCAMEHPMETVMSPAVTEMVRLWATDKVEA